MFFSINLKNEHDSSAASVLATFRNRLNRTQRGRIKMSRAFYFVLSKPCRDFMDCLRKVEVNGGWKRNSPPPTQPYFYRIKPRITKNLAHLHGLIVVARDWICVKNLLQRKTLFWAFVHKNAFTQQRFYCHRSSLKQESLIQRFGWIGLSYFSSLIPRCWSPAFRAHFARRFVRRVF